MFCKPIFHAFSAFALCSLMGGSLLGGDVRLLIPETIYAVPGVEMNVYFNNVVTVINPANYVFDVDCSKGRNDLKRWRFTPVPEDVGTYDWSIRVMDMKGVVASAKAKLVVLPPDAGKDRKLTMLMVGASQTGAGHYADRIVDLMSRSGNPEFKSIGTKGLRRGKHEGYGGWRWESFLTRWGYTNSRQMDGMHPDRPVGFNSPFLFPGKDGKGEFDLQKYFDKVNGGEIPDIVSFQLGLNDFFLAKDKTIARITAQSLQNMEKLIGAFRKLKKVPVLMIFQHIPGASQDAFGQNYACGQTLWQYRKNLDYYNRALLKQAKKLNLVVVPVYMNIDTENNFPTRLQNVNEGNPARIVRQSNGVHPAKAGYYQMGDTLYCYVKALLASGK